MRRGDFIITPAWTWHDHGNLEQRACGVAGRAGHPDRALPGRRLRRKAAKHALHAPQRPEGDALARYGQQHGTGELRAETGPTPRGYLSIPFERTRQASLTGHRGGHARQPHFGFKQRYVNPATGASPMPTIGAFAQLLPAGFETQPLSLPPTAPSMCAWRAKARPSVGEHHLPLPGPNDIFVVPSWHSACSLRAGRDTTAVQFFRSPDAASAGSVARSNACSRPGASTPTPPSVQEVHETRNRRPSYSSASQRLASRAATSASRSTASSA